MKRISLTGRVPGVMCRNMTVGRKFLPLFLFLFLENASLSAAERVQAPQFAEGDVWRFQVSHKDWITWSSDAIQSGDYEVRYTQGELRIFRFSDRAKEEISGIRVGPLLRMLGTFKGQTTLLEFPLFEGKKWKTQYRHDGGRRRTVTTDHLVSGPTSITVPAGMFEAFKIERDDRTDGRRGYINTSEYFYVVACGCIALYSVEITSGATAWPRRYFGKREITLIDFKSMQGQMS
jgi:hypothetical protein